MKNIVTFKAKINKKFIVYIITSEDEMIYKQLIPLFNKYGLAYTDLKNKNIYIDGDNVNDMIEIDFIIAHEIAHHYLKHQGDYNKMQEAEADYVAISLCKLNKLYKSEKLGLLHFKERHGIKYDTFTEKYHVLIKNKLKNGIK